MTAKRTVSLTDQGYQFARRLVERGRYASLSAVLQQGLDLLAKEEESHNARLDAIRGDLERRASQPSITTEEMEVRLSTWRSERDVGEQEDLA